MNLEQIQQIASQVERQGLDEAAVTALRSAYPDIHFTYCSDDDVNFGKSVLQADGFNVYLVDSRDHCLRFTSDIEVASGLVLAELEAEEEDGE